MGNHTFKKIIRSKIFIFIFQIALINLFIVLINFQFPISFDAGIIEERKKIIQYFGNLILYTNLEQGFILIGAWLVIAIIPILLYLDYRKALSANIKAFFFPNFFFYVFIGRYSPNYFEIYFWSLFSKTLFLVSLIIILSVSIPLIVKQLKKPKNYINQNIIEAIYKENKGKCPHCGAEFDSIPLFCYKCSKKLENEIVENSLKDLNKK